MGSGTMIVLFDRKAVHDLVDKKGVIYSERPKNHVADIITQGDSFAFMDNTPRYREQRKIASHNLSVRLWPYQKDVICLLIDSIAAYS